MIRIPFWKMHGAGNDFILVDDRALRFPTHDATAIADLCHRRTGIGSEGLILIQPSTAADFRMRFFNPDGNEVAMCGNGARCVARLARDAMGYRLAVQSLPVQGVAIETLFKSLNINVERPWSTTATNTATPANDSCATASCATMKRATGSASSVIRSDSKP